MNESVSRSFNHPPSHLPLQHQRLYPTQLESLTDLVRLFLLLLLFLSYLLLGHCGWVGGWVGG